MTPDEREDLGMTLQSERVLPQITRQKFPRTFDFQPTTSLARGTSSKMDLSTTSTNPTAPRLTATENIWLRDGKRWRKVTNAKTLKQLLRHLQQNQPVFQCFKIHPQATGFS